MFQSQTTGKLLCDLTVCFFHNDLGLKRNTFLLQMLHQTSETAIYGLPLTAASLTAVKKKYQHPCFGCSIFLFLEFWKDFNSTKFFITAKGMVFKKNLLKRKLCNQPCLLLQAARVVKI